jgi:hypothetical protein
MCGGGKGGVQMSSEPSLVCNPCIMKTEVATVAASKAC